MRIIKTLRQFPKLEKDNPILYYFTPEYKYFKFEILERDKLYEAWYIEVDKGSSVSVIWIEQDFLVKNRVIVFNNQQEANEFISEFKKLKLKNNKHNKQ